MRRRAVVLGGALLAWPALAGANEPLLPEATHLAELGTRSAELKAPIVLLFSTPGCPYCLEVRRNYLAPRRAEQQAATPPRLLFGEIDITSTRPLTDFDGRATTKAAYAARLGIRMVPVVLIVDWRGQPLAEPLVGLDRSGFFDATLQARLDEARGRLGTR